MTTTTDPMSPSKAPSITRTALSVGRLVALALALTLVAAACSDDDTEVGAPAAESPAGNTDASGDGTTADDPDTPVSSEPGDDSGDPQGGATRVEPDPAATDPHPINFEPSQVEPSGAGVLVPFYNGIEPCYALADVQVTETPDAVTVSLFGGTPVALGAPDVACIDIAQLFEVEVPLDAPLGDRTIVDGNA
jgi:hypothetical protein